MKRLPLVLLTLTILIWIYAGWTTLTLASGRLGPVTLHWTNLEQPHTHFAWSPGQSTYTLNQGNLFLKPGEKASLIIRPVERFTRGRLQVSADCTLAVTPPSQPETQISGYLDYENMRNFLDVTWSQLNRLPRGYPFTIRNGCGDEPVTVYKISLTLQP